jgi:RNA polymerase sigma-70 factor (ECF subfamily)
LLNSAGPTRSGASEWLSVYRGRYVFGREIANQELLLDADTERNLVASCQNGDKAAYAGLVQAHAGRVFAICFGMLGNRCDAEDMAQQTLLQGFAQIRSLRDSRQFGPWIARIARNLCLDAIRARKHAATILPVVNECREADAEDLRQLEAALAELSSDYRVPLLLFYFDGRSTQSIAETLGIRRAAVQTRLSRARKQLRRLLADRGDEK